MTHEADHDPPVLSRGGLLLLSLKRRRDDLIVVAIVVIVAVLIVAVFLPRLVLQRSLRLQFLSRVLSRGGGGFESRLRLSHRDPLTLRRERIAHPEQRVGSHAKLPRTGFDAIGCFIARCLGVGLGSVRIINFVFVVTE